jgi:hypothetical protein
MTPMMLLELKMSSRNFYGSWYIKKTEAKNLVPLSLGKTAAGLRKAVGPKMAAGLKRWQ